ncbi:hypothetical protein E4U46_008045 [Claviceps purpurea]|nr:hypothetical protein E4U28_006113 [Claviceps purpurea]KAG6202271.1 hypothetical protein E4U50_006371 [Claviceps purpurea]KAG6282781.1 hypothetical protein E4U46_008045 [Claviceps purpurea]
MSSARRNTVDLAASSSAEDLDYNIPDTVHARYQAARELRYKGKQPDAQTNEAFRREYDLRLCVLQADRDHYPSYNCMTKECFSGAQPRPWTDEESLAYIDYNRTPEWYMSIRENEQARQDIRQHWLAVTAKSQRQVMQHVRNDSKRKI